MYRKIDRIPPKTFPKDDCDTCLIRFKCHSSAVDEAGCRLSAEEAADRIFKTIDENGAYWNNIVSSILRVVAEDCGYDVANHVIDLCGLESLGWCHESGL